MRNHKVAISIWFVANYLLIVIFAAMLKEPSMQQSSVYITSAFIYYYVFCIFWGFLQNHIKLSCESRSIELPSNSGAVGFLNELTNDSLKFAPTFTLLVPLYYWMFRLVILPLGWLKTGEWSEFTTCDVYKQFCNFDSNALGLNILINKIGQADYGFLLATLCLIFYLLSKKTENLISG